ncbi:MAG: hypothetical protein LW832_05370, partial [Parachlamydia sp.]|nr:hypothetical protein [Parachlamydia sp.]
MKSYRSTHPDNPIPEKGTQTGEIGGVGFAVDLIEGVFGTTDSLFEFSHSFFIRFEGEAPFSNEELTQVLYELAIGIYVHDTVPFFSLHFNQEANLYPVIHPIYENTLVGQVFSMLDYFMKGYLNGGVYNEEFVKNWQKNPIKLDWSDCQGQFIDFYSYVTLNCHGTDKEYISVRNILNNSELDRMFVCFKRAQGTSAIDRFPFDDYTKFTNSFRIIAKQNKIEKTENLFVLDSDFDVEYTIAP